MKMPIVKVTHTQGQRLVEDLYDLGWTEQRSHPHLREQAWLRLLDHDSQLTHIWLYDQYGNQRSIWSCGPKRPFHPTLYNNDYNLILLNSPAHMLAYLRAHKLCSSQ